MLSWQEYSSRDAVDLANLIRVGEVTAAEIHQTALEAAHAIEPRIGAFTEGPFESAQPSDPRGEFAGVPFAIKDLLITAAGVPSHGGSAALAEGAAPEADSILMSRFRAAGLNLIGTTKSPEFGLSVTTDQKWRGPARNPWDTERSPGGSSGGSAALVAAGIVPVAHANDGAGSIRIPAAHTGLVGLKPSRGRVPIGPGQQELMYGNVVEFVVTRTVRDSAHLLDLVHGNAPGEKYGAPAPARPYREEVEDPSPRQLRIAVTAQGWDGQDIPPDVRNAIEITAAALVELGHVVEEVKPEIDWEGFLAALTTTWCAGTAAAVVPLLRAGVDRDLFEATTVACAEAGQALSPVELAVAFDRNNTVSRILGSFYQKWDLWVTPTSVGPAPSIGAFDADNPQYTAAEWVRRCVLPYPTCAVSNVTGGPAITLPLAQSSDGLPLGVQLSADIYREDILLRTAAQLEHALPWATCGPAVHVTTQKGRR
ncbi:amidase [Pseudonocardia asaccharolytica]|uniref:Amidase n=1 Tax=Pseudonocardia asaccharolytica DSM 44247 = NBRC 16224 TaxID=1123024 RepID=A0A511D602_9PSEU|nr:amidase family protein [Pseudonocardia asaccharolytica]GEL20219.1 amidase [Pseudonocardia asaccharolytica DSM 44247 = NBRC 16224]